VTKSKLAAVLCSMVFAAIIISTASADPAKTGYPNSMASTGDSITRAYNTCWFPYVDCPSNSWSTGTSSSVNSQYLRILVANGAISGKNYNDAVTGGKMGDLNGQVASAVGQGVDYVTILMGANDVCTSSESSMTSVATLRAQFQTAMNTVTSGLPNARIYVSSIPNIYNLWNVLHNNSSARSVWALFGICQSMLANPTSTAQADVDRRARVSQRNIDFNTQLQQVCALYVHCRYDNGAAYGIAFTASNVTTRDYFHPNISGQALAASVSWGATYNFTDSVAPISTATTSAVSGGISVSITASDAAGVSGIEYKIGAGAWVRYTGPVTVATGSAITYRAVDTNGNIEATHTITA
jgi:lysophospholipase L1-like esterase